VDMFSRGLEEFCLVLIILALFKAIFMHTNVLDLLLTKLLTLINCLKFSIKVEKGPFKF